MKETQGLINVGLSLSEAAEKVSKMLCLVFQNSELSKPTNRREAFGKLFPKY